jgi:hypothetical protein
VGEFSYAGERQYGGGIFNRVAGVLVLINSQVISNAADYGGGIFNKGQVTLIASRVLSNSVEFGGGGIDTSGSMSIADSTIAGNQALASANYPFQHIGGGLLVADGLVTITSSLFKSNSAGNDGGGMVVVSGTLRLANVTLAQNTTQDFGGAIAVHDGLVDGYNLTIFQNTANADGVDTATGGGIYRGGGSVSLSNSILAFNFHRGGDFYIADDCSGDFEVFTYSLVQDPTGCTYVDDHTLTSQNPQLLPLAANGGPTLTSALGPGSPALDAANPAGCAAPGGGQLATDQRGYGRHADGNHDDVVRCDIGAFEVQWLNFLPLLLR